MMSVLPEHAPLRVYMESKIDSGAPMCTLNPSPPPVYPKPRSGEQFLNVFQFFRPFLNFYISHTPIHTKWSGVESDQGKVRLKGGITSGSKA